MKATIAFRVGIVVMLTAFPSCNSFETRPTPPPCDPSTDPQCEGSLPPTTPEILRDNIERTLEALIVDPDYADGLSDAFGYVPDPLAEAAAVPGFFVGWDKARELGFMRTLLSASVTAFDVEFVSYVDTGELTDDEARYRTEYVMTATFNDGSVDCYSAAALWDLVGGNRNDWSLRVWTDIEVFEGNCTGTMGLLRAIIGG